MMSQPARTPMSDLDRLRTLRRLALERRRLARQLQRLDASIEDLLGISKGRNGPSSARLLQAIKDA